MKYDYQKLEPHSDKYFLCLIANELAESNRLKRMDLERESTDSYFDVRDEAK